MMKGISYRSVSPVDLNVQALIQKLNEYQIGLYGIENCNLEPPDEMIKNQAFMIGAFLNEDLIGIGSIKLVEDHAEIKRMYLEKSYRGLGVAETIIQHLEEYAVKQGVKRICLETGNKHVAAMKFYERLGYHRIEQFGNYQPNAVSVYYEIVKD
ncbi:MAG: GNAT family N-acetyltransferase [Bacteroidota bacterium]